ncbi:hypothetical protein GIB67_004307 [Kingdonia uniflora]|uniref:Uncharacterized protein n=1 Tax=Kingdonia uniflora TaxID=39325 RepID=A0A7J7MR20_9MAGN|nr:hypothetical protein GIB67_004307 [Kingdonia uniflora]
MMDFSKTKTFIGFPIRKLQEPCKSFSSFENSWKLFSSPSGSDCPTFRASRCPSRFS